MWSTGLSLISMCFRHISNYKVKYFCEDLKVRKLKVGNKST